VLGDLGGRRECHLGKACVWGGVWSVCGTLGRAAGRRVSERDTEQGAAQEWSG
jgi:hypothetical protein